MLIAKLKNIYCISRKLKNIKYVISLLAPFKKNAVYF